MFAPHPFAPPPNLPRPPLLASPLRQTSPPVLAARPRRQTSPPVLAASPRRQSSPPDLAASPRRQTSPPVPFPRCPPVLAASPRRQFSPPVLAAGPRRQSSLPVLAASSRCLPPPPGIPTAPTRSPPPPTSPRFTNCLFGPKSHSRRDLRVRAQHSLDDSFPRSVTARHEPRSLHPLPTSHPGSAAAPADNLLSSFTDCLFLLLRCLLDLAERG